MRSATTSPEELNAEMPSRTGQKVAIPLDSAYRSVALIVGLILVGIAALTMLWRELNGLGVLGFVVAGAGLIALAVIGKVPQQIALWDLKVAWPANDSQQEDQLIDAIDDARQPADTRRLTTDHGSMSVAPLGIQPAAASIPSRSSGVVDTALSALDVASTVATATSWPVVSGAGSLARLALAATEAARFESKVTARAEEVARAARWDTTVGSPEMLARFVPDLLFQTAADRALAIDVRLHPPTQQWLDRVVDSLDSNVDLLVIFKEDSRSPRFRELTARVRQGSGRVVIAQYNDPDALRRDMLWAAGASVEKPAPRDRLALYFPPAPPS